MTTNTFKFIDMVAKEALSIAHEESALIATVDRQYDENYARAGAKIGDALRVRAPNMYKTRSGNAMDVQAQDEVTSSITLATLLGVDMEFGHVDLSLKTDDPKQVADFSKRYIAPAMSTLISNIEYNAMSYYTKKVAQVAGTAGTAISNIETPNKARAKLNQQLAPKVGNSRAVQMDSVTMATMVNGAQSYFNPSREIGDQYREGLIKRTSMADYYENERTWTLANSADVAGEINQTSFSNNVTTLTVDGLSAAPAAGMVFVIEGIYDCHPETKAAFSHLKQFVCDANCTTASLSFSPALRYSTLDARQNCSGTLADNADITFVGAASTSYVQPLMYHREAFQFVTADLPLVGGADQCVRKTFDGLSLRVWMDGDIRNNSLLCRIDILHGYEALRPEWACRMIGTAN